MDFYVYECTIAVIVVLLITETLQCLLFKVPFPWHYGTPVYRNHLHKTGITLTYWDQVMPYGVRELSKHCFRWRFVAWWHHCLNQCWLIIRDVLYGPPTCKSNQWSMDPPLVKAMNEANLHSDMLNNNSLRDAPFTDLINNFSQHIFF